MDMYMIREGVEGQKGKGVQGANLFQVMILISLNLMEKKIIMEDVGYFCCCNL